MQDTRTRLCFHCRAWTLITRKAEVAEQDSSCPTFSTQGHSVGPSKHRCDPPCKLARHTFGSILYLHRLENLMHVYLLGATTRSVLSKLEATGNFNARGKVVASVIHQIMCRDDGLGELVKRFRSCISVIPGIDEGLPWQQHVEFTMCHLSDSVCTWQQTPETPWLLRRFTVYLHLRPLLAHFFCL